MRDGLCPPEDGVSSTAGASSLSALAPSDVWVSTGATALVTTRVTQNGRMPSNPLLGDAPGLEHLVIPVHSLQRATDDFRDRLGFAISPGSVHESGTEENAVLFGDGSYLELLGIHDPHQDTPMLREVRRLLAVREGPVTIGILVSSIETVASRLREAGFSINGPTPLQFKDRETGELTPAFNRNVEIVGDQPYLKDVLFFNEKISGAWEAFAARNAEAARIQKGSIRVHPNGSNRFAAAWMAVDDLGRAKASYAAIGLEPRPEQVLPNIRARMVEIPLGAGALLLVQPTSDQGPVAELLALVHEPSAMMGASIEVANLETVRTKLEHAPGVRESSGSGRFGQSIVVPAEAAHGVWLEFFERRTLG